MVLGTRKSNFGSSSGCGFIFGSLWNFTTKYDRHYYKKPTDILSQNTMKVYYKMCQFIQTLLRNVIIITKCDVYYKMRQCTLRATTKSGWIYCLSIRNGKHIKPSIFLTQKISPATLSNFYKSPNYLTTTFWWKLQRYISVLSWMPLKDEN